MILSDLGKLVLGFGVNGSDFRLYRRDVVTLFIFFIVEKVLLIVNRAAVRIRVKCTQIDDWSQKLPRRGRDQVKKAQNTLTRLTIRPTTLFVEQQIAIELSPIDRFGDER